MKPENIIFETDQPNSMLKVIDFGTSSYFDPNKKLSKAFGTVSSCYWADFRAKILE